MRKVGKLVERIQIAMETVMEKEDISEWSAERREEYFEKFQSHSMLGKSIDNYFRYYRW